MISAIKQHAFSVLDASDILGISMERVYELVKAGRIEMVNGEITREIIIREACRRKAREVRI